MNAQDIIQELNTLATKVAGDNPNALVNPVQLGQLAGAMESVLEKSGIVKSRDRKEIRLAIQSMVSGTELGSSKNMPFGLAVAMCSRWTQGQGYEYEPTPACESEIPALMRELALRAGQGELL